MSDTALANFSIVLETERLTLRHFVLDDAPFVLALVTDPDWLRYIGDRGVRNLDDARGYIENGPIAMYQRLGHGLWVVARKSDGVAMGMCGLLQRDWLDAVDIGYAFLPQYRGHGYARESAAAVLAHGHRAFGLNRIVAITDPNNQRSSDLLRSLGMRLECRVRPPNEKQDTLMFVWDAS